MTKYGPISRTAVFLVYNASSHKAAIVREYLKQEKIVELPHPPYLPDLAPCDFFLFPRLKKTPHWKKISNRQKSRFGYFKSRFGYFSVSEQYTSKSYENAFESRIKRLKLCVSHGGKYFEGLR